MASFVRYVTSPVRGFFNRHFNVLHERLGRVESLVDPQSLARIERELAEVREVNQALLDSVQVLGESVARLRDELRTASSSPLSSSNVSSGADSR